MTIPKLIREKIRNHDYKESTSGLASGYLQANIVILPEQWALDFLLFCQKNPIACPLLYVSQPGEFILNSLGEDVNIKTDVPEYYVFQEGEFQRAVYNLEEIWQDNWVTFALGCSFSFEEALLNAGLEIRNITEKVNVSMYDTNIVCKPSVRFSGNFVVSMRPFTPANAIRAIQITTRFPLAHGAPIHFGRPETIGIFDIHRPDYGDCVSVNVHEVPVFWACGVTPQNVIRHSRPSICITHAPGKMLITDVLNNKLAVL